MGPAWTVTGAAARDEITIKNRAIVDRIVFVVVVVLLILVSCDVKHGSTIGNTVW